MPRSFLWVLLAAATALPALAAPPAIPTAVPNAPLAKPGLPKATTPAPTVVRPVVPAKPAAPATATGRPTAPTSTTLRTVAAPARSATTAKPTAAPLKPVPELTVKTTMPTGTFGKSTPKTTVPLAVTTPFHAVVQPTLPGSGATTVIYPRRPPVRPTTVRAANPLKPAPIPVAASTSAASARTPLKADVQATPIPASPVVKGARGPLVASLIGQIRDEQGNPVVGATVSLGTKAARTDASGSYVLEKLTPGRWEVKVQHEKHTPKQTRVWLIEGLKTPLSLALIRPVVRQEATRVGLVGVGSLTQTDALAQRMAEELVRTGAFPQVGPLQFIPRGEMIAVVSKMERPLYEILDHDRPDPVLVKDFFEYMGISALAVARVDMLTRSDGDANQLNSYSKVELWQLKDGRVEIRTLVDAGRSEKHDNRLSKAETDQLYAIQITQMATEVSKKWSADSPLKVYKDGLPTPDGGQKTDTKVEIIPKQPEPKPESAPQRP